MYNCGDYMVTILVILHVVENHASWCTGSGPALLSFGLMVWIQERVTGSRWESVKRYLRC